MAEWRSSTSYRKADNLTDDCDKEKVLSERLNYWMSKQSYWTEKIRMIEQDPNLSKFESWEYTLDECIWQQTTANYMVKQFEEVLKNVKEKKRKKGRKDEQ